MKTVYVFGGPNGAGKTTLALQVLPDFGCTKFVNADLIAAGLAPLAPDTAALQSGRLMLQTLDAMRDGEETFGFESTLASRGTASFLKSCHEAGFFIDLTFLFMHDVEMHIARVADRVRAGGHNIPEATIRRRYGASLKNLNTMYLPISDKWSIYENSKGPRVVARGAKNDFEVLDPRLWNLIQEC